MSNLSISSKNAISRHSSPANTFVANTTTDSVSSFGEAIKQLQEKATVYNPNNIQPNTPLRTDSIRVQGKVVFKFEGLDSETVVLDNPIITRTGGTTIPLSISELLQQSGMTKAEAEEIARPIPPQPEEKEQTPQEMKAYLMSKQVDAVARDAAGNIVAKIYTDGSLMCSNGLANGLINCTSNLEKMRFLEKQPNITISDYTKEKVTDFDLLKEEVALTQKNMLLHPQLVFNTQEERDFYNTQREVFEFQKRILAA